MDLNLLLHEFIDGELLKENEGELFRSLADSEELRLEMKQMIAMKDAIKSDTVAFTPSPQSTLNIFSTLGFQVPAAAPVPVQTPSVFQKILSSLKIYKQALLGSVVSSVVTVAVLVSAYNYFDSSDGNSYSSNTYTGSNSNNTQLFNDTSASGIPYNQSFAVENSKQPNTVANNQNGNAQSFVKSQQVKTVYKYIYVDVSKDNKENSTQSVSEAQNEQNLANNNLAAQNEKQNKLSADKYVSQTNNIIRNDVNLNRQDANSERMLSSEYSPYYSTLRLAPSNPLGIKVEMRGTQSWQMPAATINPAQAAALNNLSVYLNYDVSDNFNIGFDLRQETFFQEFEGVDSVGVPYWLEQQPNLTSYGLGCRVKFGEILSFANPFIQLTASYNRAGFVGRIMSGTEFKLYENFAFILGLEYNHLVFEHQNSYYNAKKINLNYGISYKF